ncbi:3-phosphoinositide dependent protein kinase-1 [Balamuthia mandrillaris]
MEGAQDSGRPTPKEKVVVEEGEEPEERTAAQQQNGAKEKENDEKAKEKAQSEEEEEKDEASVAAASASSNGESTTTAGGASVVPAAAGKKKPDPPREKDYDWGEPLGEGSFGVVKKATVRATGKSYAIKIIEKKFILENKNKAIVFREREILNHLDNHPFVVTLHYTFQNPSQLFFVMDYCSNGELFDVLKKHGSFSMKVTQHYVAEMVLALEYIHSKGVMHRDFKPENILLNEDMHIKVIDFGTAKIVGRERSGSFEGTPEYMSPELLIDNMADTRCDLWALGVIVFQLLTGQLPFRGSNPWHTMQKVKDKEFEYPDDFPEDAKDLCEKLLTRNPDERLGGSNYAELKAHPFFKGIDWEGLPTSTPPPPAPMDPPLKVKRTKEEQQEIHRQLSNSLSAVTTTTRSSSGGSMKEATEGGKRARSASSGGINTQQFANNEAWSKFLESGEEIVHTSLVFKKRRPLNVKKRQLILTNTPRLIYIDPGPNKLMGGIDFTNILKVSLRDSTHFTVYTRGRDYHFEDKNKGAPKWVEEISKFCNRSQS